MVYQAFYLLGKLRGNHSFYFCNERICKIPMAEQPGKGGRNKLIVGKTAKVSVSVTGQNTARAVGSGSLDVFATPMMIALMERAACAALADVLEEGQTSVGVSISVSHTAASPVGARVTAEATVTAVSGRRVEFDVSASDENGCIGEGKHTRVIVDAWKFTKKAEAAKNGQNE